MAARLTESYRQAALALRAAAVRDVLRIWPLFNVADLETSWPALQAALEALVATRRRDAAGLAASYLRGFRGLEGVTGDLAVVLADKYDPEALRVSLAVTGPVTAKRSLALGATETVAAQSAAVAVSGAVSRHILNGGRETILRAVQTDAKALGYMRVTSGKACAFCAMLASRGPVYKSSVTAGARGSGNRYHDHCGCSVEPVYSRHAAVPAASQRFEQLWIQSTAGLSGQEARNAFRVAYEATL